MIIFYWITCRLNLILLTSILMIHLHWKTRQNMTSYLPLGERLKLNTSVCLITFCSWFFIGLIYLMHNYYHDVNLWVVCITSYAWRVWKTLRLTCYLGVSPWVWQLQKNMVLCNLRIVLQWSELIKKKIKSQFEKHWGF